MTAKRKVRGLLRTLPLKVRKKSENATWSRQPYGKKSPVFPEKITKIFSRVAEYKYFWQRFLRRRLDGYSHISRSEARKKMLRKAVRSGAIAVMAVVLILALQGPVKQYLSSLEFFRIKDIGIYGYAETQPEEIKKLAGIDYTTSMFVVSPEKVSTYISAHPWIQDVLVEKIWPDGIRIDVVEHEATALFLKGPPNEAAMVYMNRRGDIIAPIQKGDDLDYPVVSGLYAYSPAERDAALADAVMFLKLISYNNPNLPAQSVSEIHFDDVEGMVVRLVDFPFPIYFGSGEIKKKYKQLRSVLAVLYKKRNNNVDISEVKYIRMEYLKDKVLVAQSQSG